MAVRCPCGRPATHRYAIVRTSTGRRAACRWPRHCGAGGCRMLAAAEAADIAARLGAGHEPCEAPEPRPTFPALVDGDVDAGTLATLRGLSRVLRRVYGAAQRADAVVLVAPASTDLATALRASVPGSTTAKPKPADDDGDAEPAEPMVLGVVAVDHPLVAYVGDLAGCDVGAALRALRIDPATEIPVAALDGDAVHVLAASRKGPLTLSA